MAFLDTDVDLYLKNQIRSLAVVFKASEFEDSLLLIFCIFPSDFFICPTIHVKDTLKRIVEKVEKLKKQNDHLSQVVSSACFSHLLFLHHLSV